MGFILCRGKSLCRAFGWKLGVLLLCLVAVSCSSRNSVHFARATPSVAMSPSRSSLISQGTTYYVSKSGSDGYDCSAARNSGTPRLTIGAGLACLGSGDTLIVGNGTYDER